MDTQVFERDDHIYIVGPVSPYGPGAAEIEEFAFAQEFKKMAPNENLMWLKGQYVEAGRPNANGQMWTAGELSLKSLTPNFMPVTVMHDPRTAVGLIADAKLRQVAADVSRPRIDTAMAIWKHRFPEIAEECMANYQGGTLMQSMECQAPHYDCSECGKTFPKLPGGAEEEFWCEHLAGTGGDGSNRAGRILGNVTFTGTGLIFGSRGARGAYDEAHLDVFQDEVAEFHAEAKHPHKHKPKQQRSSTSMEIDQAKYDELMGRPTKEDLAAETKRADEAEQAKAAAEAAKAEAETAKEQAELAKKAAEDEKKDLEEKANAAKLAGERTSALGKDFKAKLTDGIREKLSEQAKTMSDDDWKARLDELAELTGVKADAGGTGEVEGSEEFSADEVAAAQVGKAPGAGQQPSAEQRQGVIGKLSGLSK